MKQEICKKHIDSRSEEYTQLKDADKKALREYIASPRLCTNYKSPISASCGTINLQFQFVQSLGLAVPSPTSHVVLRVLDVRTRPCVVALKWNRTLPNLSAEKTKFRRREKYHTRIQKLICTSPQICAQVEQKIRNERQVQ